MPTVRRTTSIELLKTAESQANRVTELQQAIKKQKKDNQSLRPLLDACFTDKTTRDRVVSIQRNASAISKMDIPLQHSLLEQINDAVTIGSTSRNDIFTSQGIIPKNTSSNGIVGAKAALDAMNSEQLEQERKNTMTAVDKLVQDKKDEL